MSKVQSIKCTNCAAPLKLLGGGRVESITCSYCKSVLDLNDNYKVLSNFKNSKEKHKLPFEIGMKGKLKEIEYTIIGRISYVQTIDSSFTWSDFLLFSPLYGYAWLTYDHGHLIYSKRNRTFPNLSWNDIERQSLIMVDGREYQPYDAYMAKVSYVEGELTWIAKFGDKIKYIDLISPTFGMTAENSGTEVEFYNDEYMDASEVYEAFLVPKEKQRKAEEFHPLKPFSKPFFKALSTVSLWLMLILALLMMGVSIDGSGKTVAHFRADHNQTLKEPFTLTSTKYLTTIHIKANSAKALNNFNMKLFKSEKLLFSLTKDNAYVFDPKTNKVTKRLSTWEKQAKEIIIYLDLEERGLYQLLMTPIDTSIDATLKVTVKEKRSRLNYLIIFTSMLFLFFVAYYFLGWRHRRKIQNEKEIYNDSGPLFMGGD